MERFTATVEVAAAPDAAWRILSDFDAPSCWMPFYDRVVPTETGRRESTATMLPALQHVVGALVEGPMDDVLILRDDEQCRIEWKAERGTRLDSLEFRFAVRPRGDEANVEVEFVYSPSERYPQLTGRLEILFFATCENLKLSLPVLTGESRADQTEDIPLVAERAPELRVISIPRVAGMTAEQLRPYIKERKPVILSDYGARIPGFAEVADLDWWRRRYGRSQVLASIFSKEAYASDTATISTELGAMIDAMERRPNDRLVSLYETSTLAFRGFNGFLPVPDVIPPESSLFSRLVWIGPAGLRAPFHQDGRILDRRGDGLTPGSVHNLNLQLSGRKHWVIAHPRQTEFLYPALNEEMDFPKSEVDFFEDIDLDRQPRLAEVELHECVLKPGEMLFVPVAWWHQTHYRANSINVNHFFTDADL